MAYVPANLALDGAGTLGSRSAGGRHWFLRGTDAVTSVIGAGYVSDAGDKGMTAGDLVTYIKTDGPDVYELAVASISSGAATLEGRSTILGASAATLVGFYGTAPAAQPSGAAQAAVTTTAATTTTPWGFSTSTQADAIVTLVNAVRSALVTVGLIKGSA